MKSMTVLIVLAAIVAVAMQGCEMGGASGSSAGSGANSGSSNTAFPSDLQFQQPAAVKN